jgi:hypothetical protein
VGEGRSHGYTARKVSIGKLQVKLELIYSFAQSAIPTEHDLILEQRCEAIAKVLSALTPLTRADVRRALIDPGLFVNLHKPVEADDNVCNAGRLQDFEVHEARHQVAGRVLLVWVIEVDEEVGEVARFGGEGRRQFGEETT